jgi:hypothetical protein
MFAGNEGGIYKTDNAKTGNVGYSNGATVGGGTITPSSPICGVAFAPGAQFTVPDPVIWGPLNNNYSVTQFYHGLPYPNGQTYFGGAQDNGTNRGTDAAGPNAWERVFGGDGGYVAVNPTDGSEHADSPVDRRSLHVANTILQTSITFGPRFKLQHRA